MDIVKLKEMAQRCMRDEPAYCTNACPLRIDVKAFLEKIKNNKLNAAYRLYRNAVLFPQIVSAVCDAPCGGSCMRKSFGGAIAIRKIEEACCLYAKKRSEDGYYVPAKDKKIGIVGGGLGGLGCAVKLSQRGYQVDLYEKESRLGGLLWEQVTPLFTADIIEDELQPLFQADGIQVFLGHEVRSLDELSCDAVYVATGKNGSRFGLQSRFAENSLASDRHGVFLSPLGKKEDSTIEALRQGILVATEIEGFLKVARIQQRKDLYERKPSRLKMDLKGIVSKKPELLEASGTPRSLGMPKEMDVLGKPGMPEDADAPGKPEIVDALGSVGAEKPFTREEAVCEAERCLFCGCSTCLDSCEMLAKYKKFPQKVIEDVNATLNVMEGYTVRIASRQINSCNLCGSCRERCPSDFDFEEIFLESRRQMQKAGDIPPAYHAFWLRDMEHALSPHAYAVLKKDAYCLYLFFPGCQMGSSDAGYVCKTYDYLDKCLNHVGVMLSCCGAPAYWAGDQERFLQVIGEIRAAWKAWGEPVLIVACPSCGKLLGTYLEDCKIISVYEVMASHGFRITGSKDAVYAVFDPCSSREFAQMQRSVRQVLRNSGMQIEELPNHGKDAQCCGYGGHIHAVDRNLLDRVTEARISTSTADYITYCTNCKDSFAASGKRAAHVLDLLWLVESDGSDGQARKGGEDNLEARMRQQAPSLSQRRRNREEARRRMQLRFGISDCPEAEKKMKLYIDEALAVKMNRELILEEDAQDVIDFCEQDGYKLLNEETGHYIGHLMQNHMTYWVEYRPEGEGFRLVNIYCHRMRIEAEYDRR